VRWYLWEFLELVREATPPHPLGVPPPLDS
jgi:hypothetical protein